MIYNELVFLNNSTTYVRFASNLALEKISGLLQARGMNQEVAMMRAEKVFAQESEKASLYFHNLQHSFGSEIMQNIYEFIAKKALFQEAIQFGSYDQMLRMIQQVRSRSLNEQELRQIKHLSQANRYEIALIR